MATIAEWLKVDVERVADCLREACKKLDTADGELVLDLSSVRRMDAEALTALEELARMAADKSVKLVMRGVNIDIYKVLKLARLSERFSFLT